MIAAAVALADERGLEAVGTRSVAARLGLDAPEIERLVGEHGALLDAMVDSVAGELSAPTPDGSWRVQLRQRSASLRQALLRHPWAVGFIGRRGPTGPEALAQRNAVVDSLRRAGFSPSATDRALALLDAFVIGSVIQEVAGSAGLDGPTVTPHAEEQARREAHTTEWSPAEDFAIGLDLALGAVAGLLEERDGAGAGDRGRGPADGSESAAIVPDEPRRPEPVEVLSPVLGVDGCRAGWVGALLVPGAPRPRVVVAPSIAELVEMVRGEVGLAVVGIDIPIGLPDDTLRRADALARKQLGRRASSVFTTLTRDAYAAPTRSEADAVNRRLSGQGVGAQAHALRAKVLEVDAWVRSHPTVEVLEVHPEVSFVEMSGGAMPAGKKTPEGRAARLEALAAAGIPRPSVLEGSGYAADDVLDACAVAWTAARRVAGLSRSLPDPPEVFSDGIPAAIHV